MTTELATVPTPEQEWKSPADIVKQGELVQETMRAVMIEKHHYGVIPGTGDKPTLLKPGAEKLCSLFGLAPRYKVTIREMDNGHREYEVLCSLHTIRGGVHIGDGVGTCSTMETKYRWRKGSPSCPDCGKDLRKSKRDPEWYCWQKMGGCGAKFPLDKFQDVGRIENPDIADQWNTVLKMAKKRAHIDATLGATAASDMFNQDLEDLRGKRESMQEDAGPDPTTSRSTTTMTSTTTSERSSTSGSTQDGPTEAEPVEALPEPSDRGWELIRSILRSTAILKPQFSDASAQWFCDYVLRERMDVTDDKALEATLQEVEQKVADKRVADIQSAAAAQAQDDGDKVKKHVNAIVEVIKPHLPDHEGDWKAIAEAWWTSPGGGDKPDLDAVGRVRNVSGYVTKAVGVAKATDSKVKRENAWLGFLPVGQEDIPF